MPFKHITCKLGNMRKEDEWILYPQETETPHLIMIQCERRIATIDLNEKKGFINDGKHGNSFVSLSPQLGATVIGIPDVIINQLKKLLEGTTSGPINVTS